MAKLEPIDMERVLEDLHIVTSALDYLGGVDGDESLPLPQWLLGATYRYQKRNFRVLFGQGEEASRDFASELPDSPMELYREGFGHAWNTLVASSNRLGVILEHGEVDLLDCDDNTRELLSALWENLEALPSEKPECRKRHPQKLRQAAEEGVGKRLKRLQSILGKRLKRTLDPLPPTPKAGPVNPVDARDAWIYAECVKGTPHDDIQRELERRVGSQDPEFQAWALIETAAGIRQAANRYAERHNLDLPPTRQPGRTKK